MVLGLQVAVNNTHTRTHTVKDINMETVLKGLTHALICLAHRLTLQALPLTPARKRTTFFF